MIAYENRAGILRPVKLRCKACGDELMSCERTCGAACAAPHGTCCNGACPKRGEAVCAFAGGLKAEVRS